MLQRNYIHFMLAFCPSSFSSSHFNPLSFFMGSKETVFKCPAAWKKDIAGCTCLPNISKFTSSSSNPLSSSSSELDQHTLPSSLHRFPSDAKKIGKSSQHPIKTEQIHSPDDLIQEKNVELCEHFVAENFTPPLVAIPSTNKKNLIIKKLKNLFENPKESSSNSASSFSKLGCQFIVDECFDYFLEPYDEQAYGYSIKKNICYSFVREGTPCRLFNIPDILGIFKCNMKNLTVWSLDASKDENETVSTGDDDDKIQQTWMPQSLFLVQNGDQREYSNEVFVSVPVDVGECEINTSFVVYVALLVLLFGVMKFPWKKVLKINSVYLNFEGEDSPPVQ